MGRGTLTNMVAFPREKRKSPCSSSERGTERNGRLPSGCQDQAKFGKKKKFQVAITQIA